MSLYIKILLLYTLIINIALFFTMGFDKHCAVKEKRRIPEATLFIMALLGGSIGGFLSMKLFHHKTKKWYFYVIFVIALFFQIMLWILLFSKSKTFFVTSRSDKQLHHDMDIIQSMGHWKYFPMAFV